MKELTHLDARGRPSMVDVTGKVVSYRVATARGFIRLQPETIRLVEANQIAKGNVLITAEIAGIQAAKHTAMLIPLCHPLPLTRVKVEARIEAEGVAVQSEAKCTERTGVEMEALTAVAVALLTVYDMCKAVDTRMVISAVELVSKTKEPVATAPAAVAGGRPGRRPAARKAGGA
jgi:cyclic pyranopterin phosphate synthase